MSGIRVEGNTSGNVQEVDANNNALINLPGRTAAGISRGGGPANAGNVTIVTEKDDGSVTGVRRVLTPDSDQDGRLRVAVDHLLDLEVFNYTAQNTGKHTFTFTTLAATISAAGILTNSSSLTTTSIGLNFGTFAQFPVGGSKTIICETTMGLSAQANDNTVVDFGLFQRGATTAFAPLDGVYFRFSPAGWQGVINNNGLETTTAVFLVSPGGAVWAHQNNVTYRFRIEMNNVKAIFFINGVEYGEVANQSGSVYPCASLALPWSFRHAIVGGAAGVVCQALFQDYKVYLGGALYAEPFGNVGNRVYGSYQGLSGGTMGQLMAGTVTTGTLVKPSAAVPLNASLAANLAAGLAGRSIETHSSGLAKDTDAILAQYQVPAGSPTVQGRRLKIVGLKLSAIVTTIHAAGTAYNVEFFIGFGNTATSLQTAETASMATATTKAPRRVACPSLTMHFGLNSAADSAVPQNAFHEDFSAAPIYVNPGEFVSLIMNQSGTTIPTSGVTQYLYQFVYSWE